MEEKKTAVIAIGGNSLIRDKEHQTIADQMAAIQETSVHIADLIQMGFEAILTHGNGPQVGFAVLRAEAGRKLFGLHTDPLDVCVASTQATIGYLLQQALEREFRKRGIQKPVATVMTRVVVDPQDPAFQNPTKPIGPFFTAEEAQLLMAREGWVMKEDAGRGWRRVVPSPKPKKIVEISAIRSLFEQGFVVIAVGGGGIPVVETPDGTYQGVEAVIDKDYASSLLGKLLNVRYFIISTAVEFVYLDYGTPKQRPIPRMGISEARRYLEDGQFAEGSMAPKIRAAMEFLQNGGIATVITSPEALTRAVLGHSGTWVVRDRDL